MQFIDVIQLLQNLNQEEETDLGFDIAQLEKRKMCTKFWSENPVGLELCSTEVSSKIVDWLVKQSVAVKSTAAAHNIPPSPTRITFCHQ